MTDTHHLRMRLNHYVACPTEAGGHSWRLLKFSSGRFVREEPIETPHLSVIERAFRDVKFADVTIVNRPIDEYELDPVSFFYGLGAKEVVRLIARVSVEDDMWAELEWDGPRDRIYEVGRFREGALEATMKEMVARWRSQEQELSQRAMKPAPKPKLMVRHEYTLCELLPSSMIETVPLLLPPKPAPELAPAAPLSEEEEWVEAKRAQQRRAQARAKG